MDEQIAIQKKGHDSLSASTLKNFTRHMLSAYRKRHFRIKQKQDIHKIIGKIDKLSQSRIVDKESFSKELLKLKQRVADVIEKQPLMLPIHPNVAQISSSDKMDELARLQKKYADEITSLKNQIFELNKKMQVENDYNEFTTVFPELQLKKIVEQLNKKEEEPEIKMPVVQKRPSLLEIKTIEQEIKQAEKMYASLRKKNVEKPILIELKERIEFQKLKLKNLKKT